MRAFLYYGMGAFSLYALIRALLASTEVDSSGPSPTILWITVGFAYALMAGRYER